MHRVIPPWEMTVKTHPHRMPTGMLQSGTFSKQCQQCEQTRTVTHTGGNVKWCGSTGSHLARDSIPMCAFPKRSGNVCPQKNVNADVHSCTAHDSPNTV